jgi:hypothetical protein
VLTIPARTPARDLLGCYVVVSETIPLARPDLLPNGGGRTWAPISTTVVHGAHDAVLTHAFDTTAIIHLSDYLQ